MSMIWVLLAGVIVGSCGKFHLSERGSFFTLWVAAVAMGVTSMYVYLIGDLRTWVEWLVLGMIWWYYIVDVLWHFKRFKVAGK